ncbi:class C sortase [Fundicoccus culcitae]|uniref:Class C sortase n=1 Tax=Fundicoccus culcitae TaxID=2969821 RepID=A0ABY5P9G9_9LACT|nr:class C sortase [Fundicoccus culcitae]UUX35105.1 class C sortase [Fundicoccus culcitae]
MKKPNKYHRFFSSMWFFVLLFLLGAGLILYPLVSNYIYFEVANEEITAFQSGVEALADTEKDERLALAQAYNRAVNYQQITDPWTAEEEAGVAEYARMLEVQELLGYVVIPKINERLPIYAGTSAAVLEKGVGHLEGTALPIGGVDTHSFLTAHRGLPTAQLFRQLDRLATGDIFYVTNLYETLAYQVDQIKVVEPNAIEAIQVIEGGDYLTLLTCTPYMVNSHRLLVRGVRVDDAFSGDAEEVIGLPARVNPFLIAVVAVVGVLSLLVVYVIWRVRRGRGRRRR